MVHSVTDRLELIPLHTSDYFFNYKMIDHGEKRTRRAQGKIYYAATFLAEKNKSCISFSQDS